MADRYCIASGSWNDTAIWSSAENGGGGASVPTNSDTVIFARPYVPTDVVDIPASVGCAWEIRELANVSLLSAAPDGTVTSTHYGPFTNRGIVRKADGQGPAISFSNYGKGTFHNGTALPGGKPDGSTVTLPGRLPPNTDPVYYAATDENHYPYYVVGHPVKIQPGVIDHVSVVPSSFMSYGMTLGSGNLQPPPQNPQQVVHYSSGQRMIVGEHNQIGTLDFWGNSSTYIYDAPTVGNLRFFDTDSIYFPIVSLYSDILITGNIEGDQQRVQWFDQSVNSRFILSGTGNQSISLPQGLEDRTWTADKSAGTLELLHFSGRLQGKLYDLELHNTGVELAAGLVANSVTNNSRLTIPSGKTLSTKTLQNNANGEIFGEGTLRIWEDGLTNVGFIDPRITILWDNFDWNDDNGGDDPLSLVGQKVLIIKQSGTLFGIPLGR